MPDPAPQRSSSAWSLRAFRLATSFSAASTLLGVLSTKILASSGGQEAVALASVFRNVGTLISRVLMLGNDQQAVAQLSAATDVDERRRVLRTTTEMFCAQVAIVAAIGLALFLLPAQVTVFGVSIAGHVLALAVCLLMALVNMALQLVVAILNALQDLRRAGVATVVASATTTILIYPLLRFGEVGLAMTVGVGSLAGVALGIGFVRRHHAQAFGGTFFRHAPGGPRVWFGNFSLPVLVQQLVYPPAALLVQGIIAAGYGVKGLGSYAAAAIILDTGAFVVMSGARNHVLPTLARLRDKHDRTTFLSYAFTYFCTAATLSGLGLLIAGPLVVRLLVGARFEGTSEIMAFMALCLPAQAMSYTASAVLASSRKFWRGLIADVATTLVLIGAVQACVALGAPLIYAGLAYAASHLVGAAAYLLVVGLSDPLVGVERKPILYAAACTAGSCLVLWLNQHSRWLGGAVAVLIAALLLRRLLRLRAGLAGAASPP